MRFEIHVNGQHLMSVRFIVDAWPYISDRRSVGKSVVVIDTVTWKSYERGTADEICADAYRPETVAD